MVPEAQFGIVKILRPYAGFEAKYTGNTPNAPIMFTEQGQALDPNAGKSGFSPRLIKGLPVPMGSRTLIWLPCIFAVTGGGDPVYYTFQFTWRLRNTFDNRQSRASYHYPKQGVGIPDTTTPATPDRVVIPASFQTITFNESEPLLAAGVNQNIRQEGVTPLNPGTTVGAPINPDGLTGFYQQGLLNPVDFSGLGTFPLYELHELIAAGDELIIGAVRGTSSGAIPTWQFAVDQPDNLFSVLFGNGGGTAFPDLGVYVMSGSGT